MDLMRRTMIQKEYLKIQQSIGKLIPKANIEDKAALRKVSAELLRIKRRMIGPFNELDTDKLGEDL